MITEPPSTHASTTCSWCCGCCRAWCRTRCLRNPFVSGWLFAFASRALDTRTARFTASWRLTLERLDRVATSSWYVAVAVAVAAGCRCRSVCSAMGSGSFLLAPACLWLNIPRYSSLCACGFGVCPACLACWVFVVVLILTALSAGDVQPVAVKRWGKRDSPQDRPCEVLAFRRCTAERDNGEAPGPCGRAAHAADSVPTNQVDTTCGARVPHVCSGFRGLAHRRVDFRSSFQVGAVSQCNLAVTWGVVTDRLRF